MTVPGKWITMDLQQALSVLQTHVPRERMGRRICAICRTWVEQDEHTVVPQWPCDEVRRARTVVGSAQPLPRNPPPAVPVSVARALRAPEWQRARTVTAPVTVTKEERVTGNGYGYDVRDIDVEPKAREHGVVEVTITGRASTDEPLFHEMPADDARLLGLKLIRAADASERRNW